MPFHGQNVHSNPHSYLGLQKDEQASRGMMEGAGANLGITEQIEIRTLFLITSVVQAVSVTGIRARAASRSGTSKHHVVGLQRHDVKK